ncbi:MAG: NADH-quinone oxidoreductase subunit A [Bacteroidales bacterium]|jgi:NADH-quinone oxidoreductase subunit A|nr:NADH-quinone oxidoreductase subunit A [Bacteroidales bacterium]
MNSEGLILMFLLGVALVGLAVLFSSLVPHKTKNKQKSEPYESGVPTIGKTWIQFNVGYYLFAIIFLVFAVEAVFLFPWAAVMKGMVADGLGMIAYAELIIFCIILGLGLLYAWKKQALKWE